MTVKKSANREESLFVKENPVPSYLNIGEPIFKMKVKRLSKSIFKYELSRVGWRCYHSKRGGSHNISYQRGDNYGIYL